MLWRTANGALPLMTLPLTKTGDQELYYKWWWHYHFSILQAQLSLFKQCCWIEALVLGLVSTLEMGMQRLRVHGNFKLVIQQMNRKFSLKESTLASYRAAVPIKLFFKCSIRACLPLAQQTCWCPSNMSIQGWCSRWCNRNKSNKDYPTSYRTEFILTQTINKGDWRRCIMQNLLQPSSTTTTRELRHFIVIEGGL